MEGLIRAIKTDRHTHNKILNFGNKVNKLIYKIRFQLLALAILINMNNNYTTFINVSHSLPSLSHTHTQRTIYTHFVTFTFTFMHFADAFIQSDLQLHSGYTFSLVHVFPVLMKL